MNKGDRKRKGKVSHTVRELIPFSEFLENGAVQMSDGRIFDMFEIISTDTDNLPEEAVEMYIIRYAKLYKTYSANLKIVGMNFTTDTTEQQLSLIHILSHELRRIAPGAFFMSGGDASPLFPCPTLLQN